MSHRLRAQPLWRLDDSAGTGEAVPEFPDRTGLALRTRKCASRGVLQDRSGLLKAHTGKPFDESIDRCTVFEILKQRRHGHACATKQPSAAVALRVVFNGITGGPINHDERIALDGIRNFANQRRGCDLGRLRSRAKGAALLRRPATEGSDFDCCVRFIHRHLLSRSAIRACQPESVLAVRASSIAEIARNPPESSFLWRQRFEVSRPGRQGRSADRCNMACGAGRPG